MKTKKRERATRAILSSLLSSELSVNEIEDIADTLLHDHDFLENLARLLREIASTIESPSKLREYISSDIPPNLGANLINEAQSIISRKHIPKMQILSVIKTLSPMWKSYILENPKITLNELLGYFFESASDQEARDFVRLIGFDPQTDAYLKGIMQKR
jgi:ribosome biogenesis protein Nip4